MKLNFKTSVQTVIPGRKLSKDLLIKVSMTPKFTPTSVRKTISLLMFRLQFTQVNQPKRESMSRTRRKRQINSSRHSRKIVAWTYLEISRRTKRLSSMSNSLIKSSWLISSSWRPWRLSMIVLKCSMLSIWWVDDCSLKLFWGELNFPRICSFLR